MVCRPSQQVPPGIPFELTNLPTMELRILSCSWFQPFFHTIYFCCCLAFSFGWPDFVFISDSLLSVPTPQGQMMTFSLKIVLCFVAFFRFSVRFLCGLSPRFMADFGRFRDSVDLFCCCCGLAHNTFLYLPASRKYSHSIKNLIEQQFPIDILLFFIIIFSLFRLVAVNKGIIYCIVCCA